MKIMKKLTCLIMAVFILLSLVISTPLQVEAKEPLDEILEYHIGIDMQLDGSATITYHFKWHVLDEKREGPLEDLYIGVANKHVEDIKALSDNIKNIEYTNDYNGSSGDYVKIDFYRSYYKDDIFEFDFSLNQSYLYTLNDKDQTVSYAFTPGWFPDTPIKDLTVSWNGNYVLESNCDYINDDNQLIWQTSLDSGKDSKLSMSVKYNQSRFDTLDPKKQASNSDWFCLTIIVIIILVVIVVAIVAADDGYGGGGGSFFYIGGGGGGGCASSCACACACA